MTPQEYHKAHYKTRIRDRILQRKFGITLAQYNEMLEKQGGKCKICKADPKTLSKDLAVDHCHNTGKIRGLLCIACNTALGKLKDSPELLRVAISYLEAA